MNKAEYERKTEEMALPFIEEKGFELVDVEFVKEGSDYHLRLYIDKEGGITINDCELVSRRMSDLLDENDFISEAYVLEVSSPGLMRPLKKEKDFERSIGKLIEIKLYKAVEKRKDFVGILKEYDSERVIIEEDTGESVELQRSNLSLIRLAFTD